MAEAFTNQDVNELGSRPELMMQSLQNWIKSPIFGGYYENSNAHSLIVNILEKNGIVGIGLWAWVFVRSWKIIRRVMGEKKLPLEPVSYTHLANRIYRRASEIMAVSDTYVARGKQHNTQCRGLSIYIGTCLLYTSGLSSSMEEKYPWRDTSSSFSSIFVWLGQ